MLVNKAHILVACSGDGFDLKTVEGIEDDSHTRSGVGSGALRKRYGRTHMY